MLGCKGFTTCLVPAIRNGVRTPSTKTIFLPAALEGAPVYKGTLKID